MALGKARVSRICQITKRNSFPWYYKRGKPHVSFQLYNCIYHLCLMMIRMQNASTSSGVPQIGYVQPLAITQSTNQHPQQLVYRQPVPAARIEELDTSSGSSQQNLPNAVRPDASWTTTTHPSSRQTDYSYLQSAHQHYQTSRQHYQQFPQYQQSVTSTSGTTEPATRQVNTNLTFNQPLASHRNTAASSFAPAKIPSTDQRQTQGRPASNYQQPSINTAGSSSQLKPSTEAQLDLGGQPNARIQSRPSVSTSQPKVTTSNARDASVQSAISNPQRSRSSTSPDFVPSEAGAQYTSSGQNGVQQQGNSLNNESTQSSQRVTYNGIDGKAYTFLIPASKIKQLEEILKSNDNEARVNFLRSYLVGTTPRQERPSKSYELC